MIFTVIFGLVLSIFAPILTLAVPLLPPAVDTILQSIFELIEQGLPFVYLFIDRNLALQLFQWWISLAAMLLSVELLLHVWRLIRGNVGGQDAQAESTSTITFIDTSTGESVTKTVSRRTKTSRTFRNKYPKL